MAPPLVVRRFTPGRFSDPAHFVLGDPREHGWRWECQLCGTTGQYLNTRWRRDPTLWERCVAGGLKHLRKHVPLVLSIHLFT